MRPYRGKTKDGKWVYGWYHHNHFVDLHQILVNIDASTYERYDVIPETVGQSTGLKDKNGKEIYGGDILEPGKREVIFVSRGFAHIGVGFYTQSHDNEEAIRIWGELAKMPWSFGATQAEGSEIIGTIHDKEPE